MRKQIKVLLYLGAFLGLTIYRVEAAYPDRPIKVIIHMQPGGGTDTMARLLFRQAQELTGALFYLENHAGAGGQIGYTTLATSRPDGYSIGAITTFSILTHELTRTGVGYTLEESFQPIARIVHDPVALAVRADSPIETLEDLVRAARASPGKRTWGVTALWGAHHIHYELFHQATGAQLQCVPFDGGAASRAALLGGHIDVCSGGFSEYGSLLRAGKVRVLVSGASDRWNDFPKVPTYRDLGYDIVLGSDRGFAVPIDTGPEQVDFLSHAVAKVVQSPQFLAEAERIGLKPALAYLDKQQFTAYLHDLQEKVRPMVRSRAASRVSPGFVSSPTFFPWIIGVALALCCVAERIKWMIGGHDSTPARSRLNWQSRTRLASFFGLVVLFFLLFPEIGFEISACAFLLSAMTLLAGRKGFRYLPFALATPLVLVLIFRIGLGIRLPSLPVW